MIVDFAHHPLLTTVKSIALTTRSAQTKVTAAGDISRRQPLMNQGCSSLDLFSIQENFARVRQTLVRPITG
jgi:hypothetical protein